MFQEVCRYVYTYACTGGWVLRWSAGGCGWVWECKLVCACSCVVRIPSRWRLHCLISTTYHPVLHGVHALMKKTLVGRSVGRRKLRVHTLQTRALHCWDSTTRRGCIASSIRRCMNFCFYLHVSACLNPSRADHIWMYVYVGLLDTLLLPL